VKSLSIYQSALKSEKVKSPFQISWDDILELTDNVASRGEIYFGGSRSNWHKVKSEKVISP